MKAIHKNLEISGIYCIINLKNNKRYIGSSKNIRTRLWTHRAELRHNNHPNNHLQKAWNKYTEINFDYFIIEICEEEKLLEREQFYINTMNPEYNMNKETTRPPCTIESRKKQSETRKRLYAEGKLKPTFKHLITYVYDLEGNFIKEYPSMKDAAIGEFGKNTGAIRSACFGIDNPLHRVHNRLFYLEKLEKAPVWRRLPKNYYQATYIVTDGDNEWEFLGRKAVAEFLNTTVGNLNGYINKNIKFKRKYMIYKQLPCN